MSSNSDELGILLARIDVLKNAVILLASKLNEDHLYAFGGELMRHCVKHQTDAINSTLPDSYLQEYEEYARALLISVKPRCPDSHEEDQDY